MNIKKLIEKLKIYPEELEVRVQGFRPWDSSYFKMVETFKEITTFEDKKSVEVLVITLVQE